MANLKLLHLQRFIVVGLTAFAVEYNIFSLLFGIFGLPVVIAHSISFGCGLIISFSLNRTWTFKQIEFLRRGVSQFTLYCVLALFNLVMSNILLHVLEELSLHPYLGKLVVMLLVATWNFILYKTVIFRPYRSDTTLSAP